MNNLKYNKVNIKLLSALSYIGPLFLIGRFSVEKDSEQLKFHNKQGEVLFLLMLTFGTVTAIVSFLLFQILEEEFEIIIFLLFIGISVAWLVLAIMGICGAIKSKKICLPIVCDITKKLIK